jgi:hypothetical protein
VTCEDMRPQRRSPPPPHQKADMCGVTNTNTNINSGELEIDEEPQRLPYCRFNHSYDDDYIK